MFHYYVFEEIPVEGQGMFPTKAFATGMIAVRYTIDSRSREITILNFEEISDLVLVFSNTEGTCVEVDDDDAETLELVGKQVIPQLDHQYILDEIYEAEFG
jgi:hypothetical protein